jgi:hypothetical protein
LRTPVSKQIGNRPGAWRSRVGLAQDCRTSTISRSINLYPTQYDYRDDGDEHRAVDEDRAVKIIPRVDPQIMEDYADSPAVRTDGLHSNARIPST